MSRLDALLLRLQRWVRTPRVLYRLTIGTHLLCAASAVAAVVVGLLRVLRPRVA